MTGLTLSVVIVTYNREQVLVDTIDHLLAQAGDCEGFDELLVIDQSERHEPGTDDALSRWHAEGNIRWLRLPRPDLTGAMNLGLLQARSSLVLYVDDDIVPGPDLLAAHIGAHRAIPGLAAVVGQVLQPGQRPEALAYQPQGSHLRRYMDFPFRSTIPAFVENAMAGNLSLDRKKALAVGGFDENFGPPVASRFESEFAKRLVSTGQRIWFEPSASINHLACGSGGTRSAGSHLDSASPAYGVGDYYFALRWGQGWDCFSYCARRLFREVRTKFHLRHPWYIPVKLLGELRAIVQAKRLFRRGQKLRSLPGSGPIDSLPMLPRSGH